MTREIEGALDGQGLHLGIAVATWNRSITDRLLEGAMRRAGELAVGETTVVRVPGSLELPVAALALAGHGCDAVVAIGAVIKGETDHYDIVVRETSAGLSRVALDTGIPVAHAVLAVHDVSQAMDRSGPGPDNKGGEAVDAAISTARAIAELRG
ncbi:MAG: 6,7-dimethyl-8-ribityllumazine synthase [Acidimicrobiales bacterium]|nr:6,7-dimethyl-8-ribityllumazine synthase [Acidimicrobiales bacterium]HLV91072.1 6,7-dimethyl-8-ribityllumazine synthase [Acidimicrobiia bacterium]